MSRICTPRSTESGGRRRGLCAIVVVFIAISYPWGFSVVVPYVAVLKMLRNLSLIRSALSYLFLILT